MKRILVTGGTGFLGSHLRERLIKKGHDVLCVDNFYTGRKINVERLVGNTNFEIMRHNITFPLYIEVDEIFNLACPVSPVHYQFDPVQTTKASVHGAINMLGLAKRVKAKILQASTSEVYGNPKIHPPKRKLLGQCQPDISLAKKHLSWQPEVPLKDGLKRTIPYFHKLLVNEIL